MKKVGVIICAMLLACSGAGFAQAQGPAAAPNFGDYKSVTLATKAWQALAEKNLDGVLIYTNKCLELYAGEAVKMQAALTEPITGDPQKIFSQWALNDVATCLYIQGEAYRQAKQLDKAKAAFERVVNEFAFGQAYDPNSKTFWKPADGAKDKLEMMAKGLDLDFGNMTSATLVSRMWASLAKPNLEEVIAYNDKMQALYGETARKMQTTMKEYAWESPEKIHSFWALNDAGTGMFILGEAYRIAGKKDEAKAAYEKVLSDYLYAQCWDTNGWFWKPAEAAQQKLIEIDIPTAEEVKQ